MKRIFSTIIFLVMVSTLFGKSPVYELLERIEKGASKRFLIEEVKSDKDFFELDQKGTRPVIRGNSPVSIATGLNWYLKYYAGIHLSWSGMQAHLPATLPVVEKLERHETDMPLRYYLNYCTYSYSMAFWDWNRWEKELDWMALHGLNLPLSIVGMDVVWRNMLRRLGYSDEKIRQFIAGPAFQAWWLMNNLEGWGGPNSDEWYTQREVLQKKIIKRMRELGIKPVFPGYSGMVPHDAHEVLGLNVSNPGLWCGYNRPAFLLPTDARFSEIASVYYEEMEKLYGVADYYSMDPFHEGGKTEGVDLKAAGSAIYEAMKKANPKSKWVIQAWQANPRQAMIGHLPAGDVIVLDLCSEARPQWGNPNSEWARKEGFNPHDWIYCMLLNFGGNVGLHGKLTKVIDEFYRASSSPFRATMKGVGLTMEGIENNIVMYELLCELPWRAERFSKESWLETYVRARYGKENVSAQEAWKLLGATIYDCPDANRQQGTHESIFCSRPGVNVYGASSWSDMEHYYNPQDVIRAAGMLLDASASLKENENYVYDLVDVMRQAVAEKGRLVYDVMNSALLAGEKELFRVSSERFLRLILLQDKLLSSRPEFMVGSWIQSARNLGATDVERSLYEWNARVQITTWGNRIAAEDGELRDYAHKEWNGLLRDFYYPRWEKWITRQLNDFENRGRIPYDYYADEEKWTYETIHYESTPQVDAIEIARSVYENIR
ncbi:MAG: alpha-N-acetylglucosaminidase [Bacteroidales bacterium]|nr:alpha-N-acetylglucosaminidase [Bacteroidales bacterium]